MCVFFADTVAVTSEGLRDAPLAKLNRTADSCFCPALWTVRDVCTLLQLLSVGILGPKVSLQERDWIFSSVLCILWVGPNKVG